MYCQVSDISEMEGCIMNLIPKPLKAMVPMLLLLGGCETINDWYQAPPDAPTARLGFYIDAPGAFIKFTGSNKNTCTKHTYPPIMAKLSSMDKKLYEQTLPIEANGPFVVRVTINETGGKSELFCLISLAFRPAAGATYVTSAKLDRYGENRKCYLAIQRLVNGKYEQVATEEVPGPDCAYLKTK